MTKNISKEDLMKKRLHDSLDIQFLEIDNQSAKHLGHAGDDGTGESHYLITISCENLNDLTRIQRHRKVFEIIGSDIVEATHSISIKFTT